MSLKYKIRPLLFVLVILSLVLTACGTPQATQTAGPAKAQPTSEPVEAPVEPTEPPPPAAKKVAKFTWTQEFDTLSPLYTNMWFVSVVYPAYLCSAWLFDDQNTVPLSGNRDSID